MVETCSTPVCPGLSQKELKSSCPASKHGSCHLVLTDRESLAACSFYQFPLCCQQVVNKIASALLFVLALGLQLPLSKRSGLIDTKEAWSCLQLHGSGAGRRPALAQRQLVQLGEAGEGRG